ncbi:hypothetical protein [Leptolyngbya sp. DQ-M1]
MTLNNENYPDWLQALINACERAKAKEANQSESQPKSDRKGDRAA